MFGTAILLACLLMAPAHGENSTPTAAPGNVTGEWHGALARLHLIINIEEAADGSFSGKLISVDQGNVTIPFDTVSFAVTDGLRLQMKAIGAEYQARPSDDGSELVGTWRQGGNSFPLTLRRPGAAPAKSALKARTYGRIAMEPCSTPDGNTSGLCAKYEIYENRSSGKGRKIALNIMLLPAVSQTPANDPLFALAGGPGESAVQAFPLAGYTTGVRQQRDVVLVDQRGTGASNPLPCELRDPRDAQAVLGEVLGVERLRACRLELDKKADLTQYTTSIAAEDLDDVRQALGYDKINLLGGSYGTRTALVYLRQHGEHVRSMTLEGVAPPQSQLALAFAHTTQSTIDQLIDRCAADDACHQSFPELKQEFQTIIERLEKSPAQLKLNSTSGAVLSVTLTRGMFIAALRPMLYVPQLVAAFPLLIHHAYQGDWNGYAASAVAILDTLDQELDRGLWLSVVCAEDVPGLTETAIRRETAGTYLGDFNVRLLQGGCREWPRGRVPRDFHAPVHSAVPALLISGALDPATPPQVSAGAARDLSNGRVVVVKDGTHGTGSPCIDRLISQFVAEGSAAGLDASCADDIHLPPFITQAQFDRLRHAEAGSDK
jgi:pimeloyl-ACP methyl ester carboxylesterase